MPKKVRPPSGAYVPVPVSSPSEKLAHAVPSSGHYLRRAQIECHLSERSDRDEPIEHEQRDHDQREVHDEESEHPGPITIDSKL